MKSHESKNVSINQPEARGGTKTEARRRRIASVVCATLAAITLPLSTHAFAQSTAYDASAASGMSVAVPVAVVGLSATAAIAGASVLTVNAVHLSAQGTVVVLEGIVDGVSRTVEFTVDASRGFAAGAGTVLRASAVAGGILLHDSSRAVALITNETGRHLMHNERLTY